MKKKNMLNNIIVPLADDIDIFLRVILTLLETFFYLHEKNECS